MTTENNQIAVQQSPAMASTQLSAFLGIEKGMMIDTIKRQCFKGLNPDQVTDAQLASFVSVAAQFKVNPMLPGFLYCYPERNGGIQVMIGPDLMFKLLDENPGIDSWETEVFPVDVSLPPTHATTKIYRTGKERPITYTALLSEWKVQSNPNWVTRPRHMLGIRSLKQAARQIVHGLPFDEDERKIAEMQNVTGTGDSSNTEAVKAEATVIDRPAPKPRKGAAGAKNQPAEVVVEQEPAEQPKPVENIQEAMQAREEKVAKPEPVKEAEPVKPTPRVFLKEGERLNANVKLDSITPVFMTVEGARKACFKANVSGEFVGEVRSAIGTTQTGEKTMTVNPPFVAGASVAVVLLGKMSAAPAGNPLHGKVLVWVEALQQEEENA